MSVESAMDVMELRKEIISRSPSQERNVTPMPTGGPRIVPEHPDPPPTLPVSEVGTIPSVKEVTLRRAAELLNNDESCDEASCIYHEMGLAENTPYAIVAGRMPSVEHPTGEGSPSRPSAILINYPPLISFLRRVTGVKLSTVPCFMFYPFKLLILFRDEIKAGLREMEGELRSNPEDATLTGESPSLAIAEKTVEKGAQEADDRKRGKGLLPFVKLLVGFIHQHLRKELKTRDRVVSHSLDSIAFADLWQLFQPGVTVFRNCGYQDYHVQQAYRVYDIETPRPLSRSRSHYGGFLDKPLRVACYSIGYDGRSFRSRWKVIKIKPFSGLRRVVRLDAFPIEFIRGLDLEARGKSFLAHRYGHARYQGSVKSRMNDLALDHLDGEVFVDFKTGYEMEPELGDHLDMRGSQTSEGPECETDNLPSSFFDACKTCQSQVLSDKQIDRLLRKRLITIWDDSVLTPLDLVTRGEEDLLPPYLLAFSLVSHQWYGLPSFGFSPLPNPNRFLSKLIIPSGHEAILKVIANSRPRREMSLEESAGSTFSSRRSLVVLLHGPPGSGKSSVVRSIAASAQPPRPIYHIKGGKLPSEPGRFADSIRDSLKLASRWDCLVLFDDAEIYLGERGNDIDQNRIVSMFLDALDNFTGVIFLTTNRVGLIDEAFKVRIHIALAFQPPDEASSMRIWESHLKQQHEHNGIPVTFKVKDILRFARRHVRKSASRGRTWNGRQIRNMLEAAIVFAADESRLTLEAPSGPADDSTASKRLKEIRVRRKHLRIVVGSANAFESYLEECRGSDTQRASELSIRMDNFEPPAIGSSKSSKYRSSPSAITVITKRYDSSSDSEEGSSISSDEDDDSGSSVYQ
ncbi:hypothetical protein B0T10DRAFT_607806 [Thelonectria olida]|uniref:AAA+ ATPase domain-containing protein n=1 Tax=Thelonectria olida TaxID=1576542 RepID=A0A9P8W3H7_9HYPO|nr:hypothetical protein B0T10DRAFT_607806 [Thelonectria olida]